MHVIDLETNPKLRRKFPIRDFISIEDFLRRIIINTRSQKANEQKTLIWMRFTQLSHDSDCHSPVFHRWRWRQMTISPDSATFLAPCSAEIVNLGGWVVWRWWASMECCVENCGERLGEVWRGGLGLKTGWRIGWRVGELGCRIEVEDWGEIVGWKTGWRIGLRAVMEHYGGELEWRTGGLWLWWNNEVSSRYWYLWHGFIACACKLLRCAKWSFDISWQLFEEDSREFRMIFKSQDSLCTAAAKRTLLFQIES